jgi:hypothetical protein
MCDPAAGSLIDPHQGNTLERETQSGGLSGIEWSAVWSTGMDVGASTTTIHREARSSSTPSALERFSTSSLVDLARNEDLHI